MALKPKVITFLNNNDVTKVAQVYKEFPDADRPTLKTYYHEWKRKNNSNVTSNILLLNLDTIREMEYAIQQIKDPVKRCENLSRLHQMKLKPIVNRDKKSLREMFDQI